MKLFAVSDIHSFYEPLVDALTNAGFFEAKDSKLIVLGDALDRGSDAQKTVEFLLNLHREGRLIFIRGNHEDLYVRCLQAISSHKINEIASGMSVHYTNGTFGTLLQLSGMTSDEAVKLPDELVKRCYNHLFYTELMEACVDYYETDTHIFCHGWIPAVAEGYDPFCTYTYDPDWRNASTDQWRRARWYNGMELACRFGITEPQKTIVCGHFRTSWGHSHIHHACTERGEDAIFAPFYADGIIAIDACTARTNKVNCLTFEA